MWVRYEILRHADFFFFFWRFACIFCISLTYIPSTHFLLSSPAANIRCFHFSFSEVPSHEIYHNLEQQNRHFKSYKCKFVLQTGSPSNYQKTWRAFRRRTISPHSGIVGTPMRWVRKSVNSRKSKWNTVFENEFSCSSYKTFPLVISLYLMWILGAAVLTQISILSSCAMFYVYYTNLLHVSAIRTGHLQGAASLFVACSVYGNLSQVIGRLYLYIYNKNAMMIITIWIVSIKIGSYNVKIVF